MQWWSEGINNGHRTPSDCRMATMVFDTPWHGATMVSAEWLPYDCVRHTMRGSLTAVTSTTTYPQHRGMSTVQTSTVTLPPLETLDTARRPWYMVRTPLVRTLSTT